MITLTKAKPSKKWTAIFPNGKKVSFGAYGYEDYTTHGDAERMERYLKRHKNNEDWSDPYTAGFWSRWLLWSKPSMKEAIKETEKHLKGMKINVINK
jgi:hypothetical protein